MTNKIFNFQFSIFNSKRGFTVLETLIAIAIISLAIAGATSAVRAGLVGSSLAKDQVKAFYLAQEAIELIRNKRDSNILSDFVNGTTGNWLLGIAKVSSDPCYFGKTCRVDAGAYTFTDCVGGWGACPLLKQDSSTYLYGYASGNDTLFRREIQIENISATEIAVTVQVSWTHGSLPRSFKTKTILRSWF